MTATAFQRWADRVPAPADRLAPAALAMRCHIERGEDLLGSLPPKRDRSAYQHALADTVHRSCRRVRARLVEAFADEIYSELTGGAVSHRALSALAFDAATAYPGLVPGRDRIAAERRLNQDAKEGWEIDQGLFFAGILGSPLAGQRLIEAARRPTPAGLARLSELRRTGRVELPTVTVERRGEAGNLTVHNRQFLNAEDDRLADDMETAVDLVLLDDAVRVGVVRGAEMTHPRFTGRRVFSAGINLTHLHHGQISFVDFVLRRELSYIAKILRGLLIDDGDIGVGAGGRVGWGARTVEKPWIAAVDSFAIGGGMQLLLVFDHIVADEEAYFRLPAVQEGIVPGAANLRLGRFTGARLARQVVLGGRRIQAREPEARLICDDISPAADIDAMVDAAVERLADPAVVANRRMLRVAEEPDGLFREYMAAFSLEQSQRLYSRDVLATLNDTWMRRRR